MMRIACFGYINKDAGSGVGANFLILKELLNRGYEIDFFGWKNFNPPTGLLDYHNLRFIELPEKSFFRPFIKKYLPISLHHKFDSNIGALIQNFYSSRRDQKLLHDRMRSEHQKKSYDLVLFLELYATLRIEGVLTISRVQGPPQTESEYVNKLKSNIIKYCGSFIYYKLWLFYQVKNRKLNSEINNTDIFICGSQWSRQEMIRYGLKPDSVKVLPYPINLDTFQPHASSHTSNRKKVLLWLGRIDPRKRFDLLMEAYALLLQERQDVHLKVAGGFRFGQCYKQLIDSFPFPEYVEYCSGINRSDVPAALQACDIVVQPSEGENYGFAIAEALSCGKPVILGSTNGTKDYISNSSFVFADYTPEALKQTMNTALNVLDTASNQLSLDARKAAEAHFDINQVIDSLEAIFQEAFMPSPDA